MCTHSIDNLLPHAPLHYAATGEMVKGSYIYIIQFGVPLNLHNNNYFFYLVPCSDVPYHSEIMNEAVSRKICDILSEQF